METILRNPVIDWLLEHSDPSMRYRTLRELLGVPEDDPDVAAARESILGSQAATGLLALMHPDSYWLQLNSNKTRWVGDGVEYGSFASTHFILAYLAELGLDRTHPQVDRAAERYLSLQRPDGDWWQHLSCLYGYNIRTFMMLGYREDTRVQNALRLVEASMRFDGGYLCDIHEKPGQRRKPKSCIRGSLKALAAFSEAGPDYWSHPSCVKVVDYFLNREGIFKRLHPDELVNKDVGDLNFPFIWRASLVEILFHLSRLGHGADPRLARAWDLLDAKRDAQDRYHLDWTPNQCPWKVGRRGEPNKWLTFYALLAKKAAGFH